MQKVQNRAKKPNKDGVWEDYLGAMDEFLSITIRRGDFNIAIETHTHTQGTCFWNKQDLLAFLVNGYLLPTTDKIVWSVRIMSDNNDSNY